MEQKYKTIIIIVAVVFIVGLYQMWKQSMVISDQQKKINELTSKVASNIGNIDFQEKCAKQSEKLYNDVGKAKGNALNGFINHYNPKLSKCFVLMGFNSYDSNGGFISKYLYDAYESKLYAEYFRNIENMKPLVCVILDKSCQNDQQFDSFVNIYMEN